MAEPTHYEQARNLIQQAEEISNYGKNPERAAALTAQAQVFATLHSAQVTGETADQLTALLRSSLNEMNANLDEIVRRMPAN